MVDANVDGEASLLTPFLDSKYLLSRTAIALARTATS